MSRRVAHQPGKDSSPAAVTPARLQRSAVPKAASVSNHLASPPGFAFSRLPLLARESGPAKAGEGSADALSDPEHKQTDNGLSGAIGGLIGGAAGAAAGGAAGHSAGSALGGALAGGVSGAVAAAATKPSLALSNDSYSDTATESRKNIGFDVTVPSGVTATDYALVNWIKGHMKKGDGSYFKVTMYGSSVDANFPASQVDSVDADPVYWGNSTARWNYTTTSAGFSATDSPGPALNTETGAEYALNFKIGLYKLSDLPLTTSGSLGATPLQTLAWTYSVKVAADGTFSHPSI